MVIENPWDGGAEVSVTLKQHKGFESPWIVVKGPSAEVVKKQVEEITGLSGEGLTLHELVYNAAYSFQKISTVATGLEAVVIPEDSPQAAQESAAAPESTEEENVAPVAPAPSSEPDLKATVAGLTSKKELTDVYLKNKAAFDGDSDLMDALQARFTAEDVT